MRERYFSPYYNVQRMVQVGLEIEINKTYGWWGKYIVLSKSMEKSIGVSIIRCKERYTGGGRGSEIEVGKH